jgi:acyl carrier protein
VERTELITGMHDIAKRMAESNGRTVGTDGASILNRYGFTSLDALEYLLVLEETYGVTFEDEDLSEDILLSDDRLADYILERKGG